MPSIEFVFSANFKRNTIQSSVYRMLLSAATDITKNKAENNAINTRAANLHSNMCTTQHNIMATRPTLFGHAFNRKST